MLLLLWFLQDFIGTRGATRPLRTIQPFRRMPITLLPSDYIVICSEYGLFSCWMTSHWDILPAEWSQSPGSQFSSKEAVSKSNMTTVMNPDSSVLWYNDIGTGAGISIMSAYMWRQSTFCTHNTRRVHGECNEGKCKLMRCWNSEWMCSMCS